jgi:hypothetical protein
MSSNPIKLDRADLESDEVAAIAVKAPVRLQLAQADPIAMAIGE